MQLYQVKCFSNDCRTVHRQATQGFVLHLSLNRRIFILYSQKLCHLGKWLSNLLQLQFNICTYVCCLFLYPEVLLVEEHYRLLCCNQLWIYRCHICRIPRAGQWLLVSLLGANMYLRPRPLCPSRREEELHNDSPSRLYPPGGWWSPSCISVRNYN